MEKNIRNLKIYFTVGALLVGGFFAGKQIKLCRDAHKLDSKISTALSDIVSENNNIINVAAHRGFSSKEVENSLQAITAAASESYISTIELDVRMTKDGYFVISHDDIVYALCGPNYYGGFEIKEISISNSNYSELINTPLIYCNPFTSLVGSNKIDYELIHYRILMLRNRAFKLTGLTEAIKACGDKKNNTRFKN